MQQHSPRTQAIVAVLRRGDRLLVIKRAPGVILPGYWTPPSGRIEPGETHEQALVREVEEELGVKVTPVAKVWECPTDDGEFLLHWWTAELGSDELRLDPTEVADARWVTGDEFLKLEPTFAGDRDFITHVLPTLAPPARDLESEGAERPLVEEAVQGMSEREPVPVPEEVLEGLEAVRRYAGTDVLDIATIRYLAQERGRGALAVWVDKHPQEYARGVLDGFRMEE
jgi:8-oxo-dGTP diphosphatase